jgi:uncharacterized protein YbaP (TraB family)
VPDNIPESSSCKFLPPGQSVSDILPLDVYLRVNWYLNNVLPNFIPNYAFSTFNAWRHNWERKKPVWVLSAIKSIHELTMSEEAFNIWKKRDDEPCLDNFLTLRALHQKKVVHPIEVENDQLCGIFDTLGLERSIFALNQVIQTKQPKATHNDDLMEKYRNFSLDASYFINDDWFQFPALETEQDMATAKEINDFMHEQVYPNRNRKMAAKIIDLLVNRPDSYIFAFGVLHFLGEGSIVDIVRKAGFTIDRILPQERLYFGPLHV